MKRTKKTDDRLMFKQDGKGVRFSKTDKGLEISIDRTIDPDEQLFTITNMLSVATWVHKPAKRKKNIIGR